MDNLFLTGPSGTQLNVGSWLRPYDKPDYGAKGLLQAIYSEHPLSEGGVLAYEHLGVRRMSFPLLVPSSAAFGGLAALEAQLRLCARPGAVIDIQPDGMLDAVRFDVISGRWEEEYDTYENRVLRRKGNLQLDVQPLGYLPTLIMLASTASVGLPGSIDLSGVSFIGDAPGLAELSVQATAATNYASGTWMPDAVLWSLAGRASQQAWWPAGSMLGASLTSAYVANAFAPAGTALRVFTAGGGVGLALNTFANGCEIAIPTALEPAYRGRFRVFLLAGNLLAPAAASGCVYAVGADAVATHNWNAPMASAVNTGTVVNATPALGLIDCGELTLPQSGSGLTQSQHIRFWTGPVSTGGAPTQGIVIGGAFLHALDGANGAQARSIAPQSMASPGFAGLTPGRFVAQAYERRVLSAAVTSDLSAHAPIANIEGDHRGGFPLVAAASTQHLDLLCAQHFAGASSGPTRAAPLPAAVSLSYRPRFYFLHGL